MNKNNIWLLNITNKAQETSEKNVDDVHKLWKKSKGRLHPPKQKRKYKEQTGCRKYILKWVKEGRILRFDVLNNFNNIQKF